MEHIPVVAVGVLRSQAHRARREQLAHTLQVAIVSGAHERSQLQEVLGGQGLLEVASVVVLEVA